MPICNSQTQKSLKGVFGPPYLVTAWLVLILLDLPRNLDPDWRDAELPIFSNSVARSARDLKVENPENMALNQRSCWTNWPIFTCSWTVPGSLKPSLATRSVPGNWATQVASLWMFWQTLCTSLCFWIFPTGNQGRGHLAKCSFESF